MNCFHHSDRSAVGICKSCGKGLCRDCATDLQDGLACQGRCESRVRLLNQIIDNNNRAAAAVRLQTTMRNLLIVTIGVVLILLAIWEHAQADDAVIIALFGSLGAIFVVFGLGGLIRRAQYPRITNPAAVVERDSD